jgi:hypothetical protein
MRVVFAGPSIYGADVNLEGIELRPPAAQGDLLRAVLDGATVIGLIDGGFEATASVWHKEILYAIGEGVAVVGGASMGALRAAECAAFGMEPVGVVAHLFLSEASDDDALVAITHGPAELGSPPFTEALVDCEATIAAMAGQGALTQVEAEHATLVARRMYYKDRTVANLAISAFPQGAKAFAAKYSLHRVGIKTCDAIAVIDRVQSLPEVRTRQHRHWELREPPMWKEALRAAKAARPGSEYARPRPAPNLPF